VEVVGRAVSIAEKKGVKAKPKTSETIGSVVQTIADYAVTEKIDLIVMGTRGMGVSRKCSSEASQAVLSHMLTVTVLVVR